MIQYVVYFKLASTGSDLTRALGCLGQDEASSGLLLGGELNPWRSSRDIPAGQKTSAQQTVD